ncbi:MAG: glycosyltransferase [Patescibacteria group bacterium]
MKLDDAGRKRFVYITPYYDPKVHSGANRRCNELIERFVRDYPDTFTLIVTKGKAPDGYAGNLVEVDYHFNHLSKFAAAREISRALDALPPSIVICESVPIPFKALSRHVHFQVAYDFRYFTGESKGFWYRLFFSNYLRKQWHDSEFMVTCSEFSIDELKKYVGYDPARVVKSFFGIDERVLELAKTPTPAKELDIIYVGHFEKRKNHEPLLRAIAALDPTLRVLCIGRDNGLLASLSELSSELGLTNTTLTSESLTDAELWDLYRKSRLFVYPSVYEGFGIPLIEAIGLQVPIICTDMPVFHEVGADFPLFFDANDPSDIALKIQEGLAHPRTYEDSAVHEHLKQFFWETIYQDFVRDLQARG